MVCLFNVLTMFIHEMKFFLPEILGHIEEMCNEVSFEQGKLSASYSIMF